MRVKSEMILCDSVRFISSKSQETSRLKGSDRLRQEFKLLSAKRTIGGCPRDYSAKHCPLKSLKIQLSVVLGQLKGLAC